MAIDMEQFKVTYIEESLEGLDIMETNLLSLETGAADNETINSIFRAAHSIKGGGATFGLNSVSNFTHSVETLLDQIRDCERDIDKEIIALLLTSVDIIRDMLTAEQHGNSGDDERVEAVKQQLDQLLSNKSKNQQTPSQDTEVVTTQHIGWKIIFKPYPEMLVTGNDVVRMFRELAELGKIDVIVNTDALPSLEDLNIEDCSLNWTVNLLSTCQKDQIDEIFVWVEDDCELIIEPKYADKPESNARKIVSNDNLVNENTYIEKNMPELSSASESQKTEQRVNDDRRKTNRASTESSSIRVDIEKIDALINMVGELVITQSMLSQLREDLTIESVESLKDGLGQLERNTRELQESVMRIRMIPISFAFNRFPRMIHDMCSKFGKKVNLKTSGESTELDKTVMEKIGDPLVHLVRNAMDHGIEMPEVRKASGKIETGTVHLNAFHQGGNIVIEISDDGAGLNKNRIIEKAIANGLIERGEELPESRIYDLLFQPGFSTAEKVTDVSGRGVGMDVVKKNIQALGGTVEVTSIEGQGATFTIRLPLTLAILDGQLVRVGNQTYIIPLVSIIESLQMNSTSVNAIAGKAELYKLRHEYIPIIRFYEAFNIEPDSKNLDKGLLVVVEGDGQKAGLVVDDLLAQQQVVIKSLETNFKRVDGLSGATILGDGKVALIVDVAGLIRVSQSEKTTKLNHLYNDGVAA